MHTDQHRFAYQEVRQKIMVCVLEVLNDIHLLKNHHLGATDPFVVKNIRIGCVMEVVGVRTIPDMRIFIFL
ncbi:MAG: hypothetical protein CSA81_00155 [Acidobacteria bacterium]|nr:MAG: hypothetical protein CSA81_00155 [Acidobacteriota bacterium]